MKTTRLLALLLTVGILLTSCSKDDSSDSGEEMMEEQEVKITASNFSVTVDENPEASLSLGNVTASVNTNDALSYALTSESVSGALAIDSTTGELTISDTATFDYETNPEITAEVTVSTDDVSELIDVTVSLNDIDDLEFVLLASKSKYTAASAGDWIEITEGEYNNLAESLNEVATAGLKAGIFEDDLDELSVGAPGFTIVTQNTSDTDLSVNKDAYVFAFKYVNKESDDVRALDQVKVSISTLATSSTYVNLGGNLPSHSGLGVKYFVLKGNSHSNTTEGLLAFYSSSNMGGSREFSGYSTYNGGRNNTNATSSGPETIIYQYQALTTTQKQW